MDFCRKNLKSLVLERSDNLRATGAAIAIFTNGWRALDQLGIGELLREKAVPLKAYVCYCNALRSSLNVYADYTASQTDHPSSFTAIPMYMSSVREIYMDDGVEETIPNGKDELRCVKRSDLIKALAGGLPPETIRFGCQVFHVDTDPESSNHVLHLNDGSTIIAKVVIGCDGVNSIIAEKLQLKAPRIFSTSRARGYTYYPNGHPFHNEFVRMRKNHVLLGRLPVDDRLVYWFVGRPWLPEDRENRSDPKDIIETTLKALRHFPTEDIEMVKNTDVRSINLTRLRYRAPWEVLIKGLHKGTMTVAGDAMHAMIPYLGQGGSAALEDAVVLARCVAQEMDIGPDGSMILKKHKLQKRVETAFGAFVRERRWRLWSLLAQTFLEESRVQTKSPFKKFVFVCLLKVLFGDPLGHAQYDCGSL
ncbi:hypothetical protein Taro_049880 [Colocasia esculenta]|uniref:FAD-binding domain-containing protein n=1 Tax=Colocasia esculenta TaxID=4460 RepID=A0A843XCF9_COLES|nr:hypothetical protein [Colocasia esculenta]